MDKDRVIQAFRQYTGRYDPSDTKILLKIEHTYQTADLSRQIAEQLQLDADGCSLAWLLGMLHDIGRFEQIRRYGTFLDHKSIDHAQLGADILFSQKLIYEFVDAQFYERYQKQAGPLGAAQLIETAVRLHNQFCLPKDLDEKTKMYCQILRDADKADIFRVLYQIPYEERIAAPKAETAKEGARPEVMRCVMEHHCVPRLFERTKFESLVSHCCMAFELVYPQSRKIVREQGYLYGLLECGKTQQEKEQLWILRNEIEKEWKKWDGH